MLLMNINEYQIFFCLLITDFKYIFVKYMFFVNLHSILIFLFIEYFGIF